MLLVGSTFALAKEFGYNLEREGLRGVVAVGLRQALDQLSANRPSAIIVDLGSGVSHAEIPLLVESARGAPMVVVAPGEEATAPRPDAGDPPADRLPELLSRIGAQLRAAGMVALAASEGPLRGGPVELDPERHEILVHGEAVWFTPKEFELLKLFLARGGHLLPAELLVNRVWGHGHPKASLYVHVKRLRHKIEQDPHHPRHILTMRGQGYKFVG